MSTKIEWCDETINPIQDVRKGPSGRGYHCTKCSPGCDHCYAERINKLRGNGLPFILPHPSLGIDPLVVFELIESELQKICAWKKSRAIFVQSMGDLFHESMPDELIDQVFNEMGFHGICHTFLTLTKRHQRMLDYYKRLQTVATHPLNPFPNVWSGLTVCNQQEADEKIPIFLQVPGKKFLSIEPMLGPIDLRENIFSDYQKIHPLTGEYFEYGRLMSTRASKIGAILLGGETGPGARPMHPDWVRSVRDQCQTACVPFFFKSWGVWKPCDDDHEECEGHKSTAMRLTGEIVTDENPCWKDKAFGGPDQGFWKAGSKSGRLLDGKEYNELPWSTA